MVIWTREGITNGIPKEENSKFEKQLLNGEDCGWDI